MVDYRKDNLDYCDYCAAFGTRLRLSQIISSGRCRTGPKAEKDQEAEKRKLEKLGEVAAAKAKKFQEAELRILAKLKEAEQKQALRDQKNELRQVGKRQRDAAQTEASLRYESAVRAKKVGDELLRERAERQRDERSTRCSNRASISLFTIKGEAIVPINTAKILGVVMDTQLWYKQHIAKVTTKGLLAALALKLHAASLALDGKTVVLNTFMYQVHDVLTGTASSSFTCMAYWRDYWST
jgi:hypothetical protein